MVWLWDHFMPGTIETNTFLEAYSCLLKGPLQTPYHLGPDGELTTPMIRRTSRKCWLFNPSFKKAILFDFLCPVWKRPTIENICSTILRTWVRIHVKAVIYTCLWLQHGGKNGQENHWGLMLPDRLEFRKTMTLGYKLEWNRGDYPVFSSLHVGMHTHTYTTPQAHTHVYHIHT